MGVFDKLLNMMNLDGEDEYDELEEFDDDDEEFEEETPKKSFFKKKEKDFDYDLEDAIVKETKTVSKQTSSKVTPITRRRAGGNMEVCVIKPTSFEDAREITETLLSGRAVVLNFEGLDVDMAQRIIDFTCGTCVAIDGNLRKISNYIFIVTPKSVDITGDFDLQNLLTESFDVSGIKTDF